MAISGRKENKNIKDKYFDIMKTKLSEIIGEGYKSAVVSLPDNILYKNTMEIIEEGFKEILLEKPGALHSWELRELV